MVALVEGPTERIFVQDILGPYLARTEVYITPIILTKPGQKGGDVRFSRARNDIERHLKQRSETWLTLLVDYFGIKGDWPGYEESKRKRRHTAQEIGIDRMRESCPLFNEWVSKLENLNR